METVTSHDLTAEQKTKLIRLLRMVEQADLAVKAVWLPEHEREEVAEIRRTLERT